MLEEDEEPREENDPVVENEAQKAGHKAFKYTRHKGCHHKEPVTVINAFHHQCKWSIQDDFS